MKASDLKNMLTLEDYERLFRRLNIEYKITNSDYYSLRTACHNIEGGKFNLSFYIDSMSFTCWSECNCTFDIFQLITKVMKTRGNPMSFIQVMRYICNELNIPFNFKDKEERDMSNIYDYSYLSKYTKINKQKQELQIYDKSILNYFENLYHEDWIDNYISIETMEKYGIKWYGYHSSIVIPCFNLDGELIGM